MSSLIANEKALGYVSLIIVEIQDLPKKGL
jgi:hypothetical protein